MYYNHELTSQVVFYGANRSQATMASQLLYFINQLIQQIERMNVFVMEKIIFLYDSNYQIVPIEEVTKS